MQKYKFAVEKTTDANNKEFGNIRDLLQVKIKRICTEKINSCSLVSIFILLCQFVFRFRACNDFWDFCNDANRKQYQQFNAFEYL